MHCYIPWGQCPWPDPEPELRPRCCPRSPPSWSTKTFLLKNRTCHITHKRDSPVKERDKPPATVLRIRILLIRHVYPGCRIRIFNPGPRVKKIPDPGSASKSFRNYNPGCSSRIPDPDLDLLPVPDADPGIKKAPDLDSQHWIPNRIIQPRILILNTALNHCSRTLL